MVKERFSWKGSISKIHFEVFYYSLKKYKRIHNGNFFLQVIAIMNMSLYLSKIVYWNNHSAEIF